MKMNQPNERYSRQIVLKGFGWEAQQKLGAAKVLVIGAGGLGCPALQYLAAAGVGHIGIVDDDVVALSNLHRQVLYAAEDIGRLKTKVAAANLRGVNPEIKVTEHPILLDRDKVLELIKDYDWILDGTDNFTSRYLINDACALFKKPLVFGAVSGYEGQVAVFNVKDAEGWASNYRDLFPQRIREEEVLNCTQAGVLGVLPGIIGIMMAAEVIKLITGIGAPLTNSLLNYHLLTNEMYIMALTPSDVGRSLIPESEESFLQLHEQSLFPFVNKVREIDAQELILLYQRPSVLLIDVRDHGSRPVVLNFEHVKIPISAIKEEITGRSEQAFVLFCQHGTTSVRAAAMVKEVWGSSREIYSLQGGLMRWITELNLVH